MCCRHNVEGVLSGVGSDEGDVVCGMPVSGGGFEGEGEGEERVDLGDDVTALRDGEGAGLDNVKGGCKAITGGQKSFCMSTTRRADLVGSNAGIVYAGWKLVMTVILKMEICGTDLSSAVTKRITSIFNFMRYR